MLIEYKSAFWLSYCKEFHLIIKKNAVNKDVLKGLTILAVFILFICAFIIDVVVCVVFIFDARLLRIHCRDLITD